MGKKKTALTGIKPTGIPHLGNYIGAIKPAIEMAASGEYEGYYFIADYHSLTSIHDGKTYRNNIYEVAASWMAMGLGQDNIVLYKQSDVPEVCEINWILSCFTAKGLMNRAHAYKAIIQENEKNGRDRDHGISMGTYSYPVLMAADILFINSDVVPVGADQLQHIEIARDIANAFNYHYGEVFNVPEAMLMGEFLVPGLDGRKMSKSYQNHIPLFSSEKKLKKMVGRIVTDSSPPEASKDPERSLIFDIYKFFATQDEIKNLHSRYGKGISWGEAKSELFGVINSRLEGPREIYNELITDTLQIDKVLQRGAQRVREKAAPVLTAVKKAIGAL